MDQHAARFTEATQTMQVLSKQIRPWAIKAAQTVGAKLEEVYRAAAPPNWPVGDSMAWADYPTAITLSFEEGIPLAWAPDPETVQLLLTVPIGPGQRTACRAVLADRSAAIPDHCEAQWDELTNDPDAPADQQRMVEVRSEGSNSRPNKYTPSSSAWACGAATASRSSAGGRLATSSRPPHRGPHTLMGEDRHWSYRRRQRLGMSCRRAVSGSAMWREASRLARCGGRPSPGGRMRPRTWRRR